MTNVIIKQVKRLAKKEKMPIGLIMEDRDKITIMDFDTESIASIDDNDNASDSTYSPPSDDDLYATELTGGTFRT